MCIRDSATTESILEDASRLTTAELVNQFLESNPVEDAEVAEIQLNLITSENESGLTESEPTSEPTSELGNMVEGAPEEAHEDDLVTDIEPVDVTMTEMVEATPLDGFDDYSSAAV